MNAGGCNSGRQDRLGPRRDQSRHRQHLRCHAVVPARDRRRTPSAGSPCPPRAPCPDLTAGSPAPKCGSARWSRVALAACGGHRLAFTAAFAAIAHVHRTMSAHDAGSDLARIARDAHRAESVDPETLAVLTWRRPCGTVAAPSTSQSRRYLHATVCCPPRRRASANCGRWTRCTWNRAPGPRDGPLALDLAASQRATQWIAPSPHCARGVPEGLINAGGDLRVFGDSWMPIRVRHPRRPPWWCHCSTSATAPWPRRPTLSAHAAQPSQPPRAVAPPLQPLPRSVTVVAPTCALADAMTKIVALQPAEASAILARHGAHAFLLDEAMGGTHGNNLRRIEYERTATAGRGGVIGDPSARRHRHHRLHNRLSPWHRRTIYALTCALVLTGTGWLIVAYLLGTLRRADSCASSNCGHDARGIWHRGLRGAGRLCAGRTCPHSDRLDRAGFAQRRVRVVRDDRIPRTVRARVLHAPQSPRSPCCAGRMLQQAWRFRAGSRCISRADGASPGTRSPPAPVLHSADRVSASARRHSCRRIHPVRTWSRADTGARGTPGANVNVTAPFISVHSVAPKPLRSG